MKSEVAIRLTWSKIMAFVILACSMYLDIFVSHEPSTFFMAAPHCAGLTKEFLRHLNDIGKW